MPPKNISAARPLSGTVSIPICSATVSSRTYYVIHRAACRWRSPKLDFRFTEFSEVRQEESFKKWPILEMRLPPLGELALPLRPDRIPKGRVFSEPRQH